MTLETKMLPRAPAERVFELDDIEVIRAEQGGDGRTVRAYCAVYNVPVVVTEPWGDKFEEIIRGGAFSKTIRDNGTRFQVFYNHGLTLQGTPAPEYAMPLGVPIDVAEDAKGVITTTRYANTPLADQLLELIAEGAIRGQSFFGEWIQSRLIVGRGAGGLDLVERIEVAMREYGPTPFPIYQTAKILSVRSGALLLDELRALPDEERAALLAQVADTEPPAAGDGTGEERPSAEPTPDPPAADGTGEERPSLETLALAQAQRRRRADS